MSFHGKKKQTRHNVTIYENLLPRLFKREQFNILRSL